VFCIKVMDVIPFAFVVIYKPCWLHIMLYNPCQASCIHDVPEHTQPRTIRAVLRIFEPSRAKQCTGAPNAPSLQHKPYFYFSNWISGPLKSWVTGNCSVCPCGKMVRWPGLYNQWWSHQRSIRAHPSSIQVMTTTPQVYLSRADHTPCARKPCQAHLWAIQAVPSTLLVGLYTSRTKHTLGFY